MKTKQKIYITREAAKQLGVEDLLRKTSPKLPSKSDESVVTTDHIVGTDKMIQEATESYNLLGRDSNKTCQTGSRNNEGTKSIQEAIERLRTEFRELYYPMDHGGKRIESLFTQELIAAEKRGEERAIKTIDAILESKTGKHTESGEIERSLFGDTIFHRKDLIMKQLFVKLKEEAK